jgi:SAM-dependent methyltransferase
VHRRAGNPVVRHFVENCVSGVQSYRDLHSPAENAAVARAGKLVGMATGHPHRADGRAGLAGTGDWDERYRANTQIWSGRPNGALVTEVGGEAPGRALDVGCGEGADAVWLAQRGWQVTALDVSKVALDRAKAAALAADVEVRWLHAGLIEARLPEASFDLVSAQYPALLRTPGDEAVTALFAAVAPGGTLLFVHHADMDHEHEGDHDFDPADYIGVEDVRKAALTVGWKVHVDERRPRSVSGGGGAHHIEDLVLRLTRRR